MSLSGLSPDNKMSYYAGFARGMAIAFIELARANVAYPEAKKIYVKNARAQQRWSLHCKQLARLASGPVWRAETRSATIR